MLSPDWMNGLKLSQLQASLVIQKMLPRMQAAKPKRSMTVCTWPEMVMFCRLRIVYRASTMQLIRAIQPIDRFHSNM